MNNLATLCPITSKNNLKVKGVSIILIRDIRTMETNGLSRCGPRRIR